MNKKLLTVYSPSSLEVLAGHHFIVTVAMGLAMVFVLGLGLLKVLPQGSLRRFVKICLWVYGGALILFLILLLFLYINGPTYF